MNFTKQDFIHNLMHYGILQFGEFTLKSGRVSPYFFNAGLFNAGSKITALAEAYTANIQNTNLSFDTIYGPAYKGIPLCVSVSMQLSAIGWDHGYTFDRKEEKDHGDGGTMVGMDVEGKNVLIIDDVITSGMSIDEAITKINNKGGKVVAIIVALDRQEKGLDSDTSAIQDIEKKYEIPVYSILKLEDLIQYCEDMKMPKEAIAMYRYHEQYGVGDLQLTAKEPVES